HPSGKEVWFDGVSPEGQLGIFAVDLAGKTRTVATTVDVEGLHDIARDGTALVEREISTREILFGSADTAAERNLSWLDESALATLSGDGKTMLFDESGEGGGKEGSVYL